MSKLIASHHGKNVKTDLKDYLSVCDEPGHECLVLEYFAGGAVNELLKSNPELFSYSKKLSILVQAAAGIIHLHHCLSRGIK